MAYNENWDWKKDFNIYYFNDKRTLICNHHIETYNDFIENKITKILSRSLNYKSNNKQIKIDFEFNYLDDFKTTKNPNYYIIKNKDYKAPIYVDIKINENNTKKEFNKILLCELPLMVYSNFCSLYKNVIEKSNDNKEIINKLYNLNENIYEYGGYFIINGKEKVLVSQDRLTNNKIYLRKDKEFIYVCEIKSVEIDKQDYKPASTTYIKFKREEILLNKKIVYKSKKEEDDEEENDEEENNEEQKKIMDELFGESSDEEKDDINDQDIKVPEKEHIDSANLEREIEEQFDNLNEGTFSYKTKRYKLFSTLQIYVSFPNIKDIPLFILFRALGIESDKEIIDSIIDINDNKFNKFRIILDNCRDKSYPHYTQRMALLYIFNNLENNIKDIFESEYVNKINEKSKCDFVLKIIYEKLLPHTNIDTDLNYYNTNNKKSLFLGYCIYRLLNVLFNYENVTDRDVYTYKRLDCSGKLLSSLFRDYYENLQRHIKSTLSRLYKNDKSLITTLDNELESKQFFQNNYLKHYTKNREIITEGFRKAFKGSWGVKNVTRTLTLENLNDTVNRDQYQFNKEGIAQELKRMSHIDTISHLRRAQTPMDSSIKLTGPRKVNSTQYGYICPLDTPEGGLSGLIKNLSVQTKITVNNNDNYRSIQFIIKLFDNLDFIKKIHFYNNEQNIIKIFINGDWMYYYNGDKMNTIYKILKLLKRNNIIYKYTSISWNRFDKEFYIYADEGRYIRPVYVVNENDKTELIRNNLNIEYTNENNYKILFDSQYKNLKYPEIYQEIIQKEEEINNLKINKAKNFDKLKFYLKEYIYNILDKFNVHRKDNNYDDSIYEFKINSFSRENLIRNLMKLTIIIEEKQEDDEDDIEYDLELTEIDIFKDLIKKLSSYDNININDLNEILEQINLKYEEIDMDNLDSLNDLLENISDDVMIDISNNIQKIIKQLNKQQDNKSEQISDFINFISNDNNLENILNIKINDTIDKEFLIIDNELKNLYNNFYINDKIKQLNKNINNKKNELNDKLFDLVSFNIQNIDDSNFDDFYNELKEFQMPIEFIDPEETLYTTIALDYKSLKQDLYKTNEYMDMHPSLMFGGLTCMMSFLEHNPCVRATYSHAQSKQSICIPVSNFRNRVDTLMLVLNYPQLSLSYTNNIDLINYDKYPTGMNGIVAMNSFMGYNQEDAIIVNKSSLERGLYMTTHYSTYTIVIEDGEELSMPKEIKNKNKNKNYDKLGDNAIIKKGQYVNENDIIVCKYTLVDNEVKDTSVTMETTPFKDLDDSELFEQHNGGYVDNVIQEINEENEISIRIKIRYTSPPEVADKFCSRYANKGVVGLIVPQDEMPYTKDGIVPDIMINPHSMPSRQTLSNLFEILTGKLTSLNGLYSNGSPFQNVYNKNESKMDLLIGDDDVKGLLNQYNFDYKGNEFLYNGSTSEQLSSKIFIGVPYYQRLKHLVRNKINARDSGPKDFLTRQPVKGRKRGGGIRVGEMERDSIISHGVSEFMKESYMKRSDNYKTYVCNMCGRISIYNTKNNYYNCNYCNNTTHHSEIHIPYATKLFMQEVETTSVALRLITDKEQII